MGDLMKSTKSAGRPESRACKPTLTPLAAAVLVALYPALPLMAQEEEDNAEDEQEQVEEVVVTGSRIRTDTFSSAAPMEVVLIESAEVRGIAELSTLLQTTTAAAGSQQITSAVSSDNPVTVSSDTPGGMGVATLSLRGLGANRTLVLLNGRRLGPAGVQAQVAAFDLNVIPLAAIQRVEILQTGASSIYGSDAIAGVVNIITRKDEGGELEVFYSQPVTSGGESYRVSGSWGTKLDDAYFRVTADYNRQEMLRRGQRGYFDCPEAYLFDANTGGRADLIDPVTGEYNCGGLPWGHVWVYDSATEVGDGTTNVGPPSFLMQYDYNGALAANGLPPLQPAAGNPNWLTTPPGWYPVEQGDRLSQVLSQHFHPLENDAAIVPKSEVATVFLEGEYDIDDNTTLYSELLLNRRETTDDGYRQIWTYLYTYDSGDLGNPSDPSSAGWTGAQILSPLIVAPYADGQVRLLYTRAVAGLRGELETMLPDWNWDVSFQYSRSDGEYDIQQVLSDSLAMSTFRTASCEGEVTPVSNVPCADVPWLDPQFIRGGTFSDPVRNFLIGTETGTTEYTQWSMEAYMTGEVMELPAGPAAVAYGVHYRNDELLDTPGPITLNDNAHFGSHAGITAGETSTYAVFGELGAPLLADMPLIHQMNLTASARYTDVEAFGSDTTYKLGLNWYLNESLRLRSTFGTSFRAPSLYELYLEQSTGFAGTGVDPCGLWGEALAEGAITQTVADNCAAEGIPPDLAYGPLPVVITGGGIGVLDAETSKTLTAGFVWQPGFADLALSVDYFDIEVNGQVAVLGTGSILLGCYSSEFYRDEALCDLFTRTPADGRLPYLVTEIRNSYINIATQKTRGLDVALHYNQELPGSLGVLRVDSRHTIQFEDTVGIFIESQEDFIGQNGHPSWVGNLRLTLDNDPWSVFWGMSFIGATDNYEETDGNTATFYGQPVIFDGEAEFTQYHNLTVSRIFEGGYEVRLGVANLFNEHPPVISGRYNASRRMGNSAFYSQYDWFGRRYFLNVSMNF